MDGRFLRSLAADNPTDPQLTLKSVTSPAAGADFSVTVPGDQCWLLVAVSALLTPDNNATARAPVLQFSDGSTVFANVPTGTTIAASTATTIGWIADGATTMTTAIAATLTVNTPKLILPAGFKIASATTAIHSGDQWSAITVAFLQVFMGDVEYERSIGEQILDKLDALIPPEV